MTETDDEANIVEASATVTMQSGAGSGKSEDG